MFGAGRFGRGLRGGHSGGDARGGVQDDAERDGQGRVSGHEIVGEAPHVEARQVGARPAARAEEPKEDVPAEAQTERKAAQENQRRSRDEWKARPTRDRQTTRATRDERTARSKPVRMRSGLDDMTRLDDLMPAPSRPKTQKKKKKSRRDDPFDLGGFRLM